MIEELAVNRKSDGQRVLTFLRLVRVSRTKEALQLRSLMMGRDFVNFMTEMVLMN
jgi:hypothetical protein